jgi:hypothetical protein
MAIPPSQTNSQPWQITEPKQSHQASTVLTSTTTNQSKTEPNLRSPNQQQSQTPNPPQPANFRNPTKNKTGPRTEKRKKAEKKKKMRRDRAFAPLIPAYG